MVTSCSVNMTVQPESQMGPIPTSLLVKNGMMCPSHGMSLPHWGIGSVAVAVDDTTRPLEVDTCSFIAEDLGGPWGACVAIYRCEAPVSEIPVWIFRIAKRDGCVEEGFSLGDKFLVFEKISTACS